MGGKGGRCFPFLVEASGVSEVLSHAGLQVVLGATYVDFPSEVALGLINADGVSADIVVPTPSGGPGVAVAWESIKI